MLKLQFVVFILVFSSIYLGMHYYVFTRISNGLDLSLEVNKVLKICFLIAALTFILSEVLSRHTTPVWVKPVITFGFVWLGVIAISITVFVLSDLLQLFFRTPGFRHYSTIFSLILILVLSSYSWLNGARDPVLKEIKIKSGKLPGSVKSFTIVQISDLHVNLSKSSKWLERVVDKANREDPDLIVITGDLIDADLTKANHYSEILGKLKSKYGVYGCTGNHEFYAGVKLFENIAEKSNIILLRNSSQKIDDIIELAGVDDKAGKRFWEKGDDLPAALLNMDFSKPVVLLSHQPDLFDKAREMGVDLQLSGHTHAGQIPPLDFLEQFIFKYPYGLYKRDSSYVYTSPGTGYWGPPMRLFSRSEITKIIIEK